MRYLWRLPQRTIAPNALSVSWIGALAVIFLLNLKTASATAIPSFKDHFSDLLPNKNATGGPVGEIHCYALPYGAIGVLSHLLTYWTIAWMGFGRSPLWPFHRTESSNFDIALAIVSLVTCIPLAAVSIHRCRLSWHFILIGVWKLVMSVTLGCTTIHRSLLTRKVAFSDADTANLLTDGTPHLQQTAHHAVGMPQQPHYQQRPIMYKQPNQTQTSFFHSEDHLPPQALAQKTDYSPLYWLVLYLLGTITGMVGLFALIIADFRNNKDVRSITYGFIVIILLLSLTTAIYWYKKHWASGQGGYEALKSAYIHTFGGFVMTLVAAFGFFSALYSDLVLAAVAKNWSGFPTEDNAVLYWAWFVAKRLPMFSH